MNQLQATLEAVLFAAGDPIDLVRLVAAVDSTLDLTVIALRDLSDQYDYEQRGMAIVQTQTGSQIRVQMVSRPLYAEAVRRALESRRPPALSPAALEVLTIVAYRQPVTRMFIEQLRGVDSGGTVANLMEKGLLEEAGRLEVIGRPMLLRTTDAFLRAFSLGSLGELPPLPELMEGEQLQLEQVQEIQEVQA